MGYTESLGFFPLIGRMNEGKKKGDDRATKPKLYRNCLLWYLWDDFVSQRAMILPSLSQVDAQVPSVATTGSLFLPPSWWITPARLLQQPPFDRGLQENPACHPGKAHYPYQPFPWPCWQLRVCKGDFLPFPKCN